MTPATFNVGDIVRLNFMLSGFNVGRITGVESFGFYVRRAFINADGNASYEELYFNYEDTIVRNGLVQRTYGDYDVMVISDGSIRRRTGGGPQVASTPVKSSGLFAEYERAKAEGKVPTFGAD